MSGFPAMVMPESLAPDFASLCALLDTYGHTAIPCRASRKPELWTGSDREQEQAALECLKCPALDQCDAHGRAHPAEVGCYGGVTDRRRSKEARAKTKREAQA